MRDWLRLALFIPEVGQNQGPEKGSNGMKGNDDKGVLALKPVWQTWKRHLELRLGEVRWFTCATPVTVIATPSAVSTSSHLGCRVIISRVILWKTQKRETKQKKLAMNYGKNVKRRENRKKVGLKEDVKVNNTKWICRVKKTKTQPLGQHKSGVLTMGCNGIVWIQIPRTSKIISRPTIFPKSPSNPSIIIHYRTNSQNALTWAICYMSHERAA